MVENYKLQRNKGLIKGVEKRRLGKQKKTNSQIKQRNRNVEH